MAPCFHGHHSPWSHFCAFVQTSTYKQFANSISGMDSETQLCSSQSTFFWHHVSAPFTHLGVPERKNTHTHIDTIDTSTFRSGSPITSCGSPTSGTPLTDTPSFASTERSTLDPSLRSALGSPKKLCLGRRGFSTVAVCRGAKKGRRTEGTSL